MKKLFIFVGAALLGIGAFGVSGKKAVRAGAGEPKTGLAALLEEFSEGKSGNRKYTKKTTVYVRTDVGEFDAAYFHNRNQQFQRTTYYADDILLMGDLNGGFAGINSGYANDGEGNMVHFSSKSGVDALDDPTQWAVDYSVKGKTMSDYFYDLAALSDLTVSTTGWSVNEGVYTYTIGTLEFEENGDYKDEVLKAFQYFAAPMLLMHKSSDSSHYLSPSSIEVARRDGALSIKLFAASDTGKLWSAGGLLSEARVYKDIVMPGYFLAGNLTNWELDSAFRLGDGNELDYAKSFSMNISEPGEAKGLHLKDDGYTEWIGQGENHSNIIFDHNGLYDVSASKDGKMYTSFVSVSSPVKFKIHPSTWDNPRTIDATENVYIAGTFTGWTASQLMNRDDQTFTLTLNIEAGNHSFKYVIEKDGSVNWDALNGSDRPLLVI